jgi:hypothetical protein
MDIIFQLFQSPLKRVQEPYALSAPGEALGKAYAIAAQF